MKQFMAALAALLFIAVLINPANAKHKKHYRIHHYNPVTAVAYDGHTVSHPAGCPGRAFCGCGVSVKVFGHPVRNLFLASNWYKFPRTSAGPGMVAVRNHHVMYIEHIDGNGNALVYDPNSGGHQTRIHTRSLAGYSIVNPHSVRSASENRYSVREARATFQDAGARPLYY